MKLACLTGGRYDEKTWRRDQTDQNALNQLTDIGNKTHRRILILRPPNFSAADRVRHHPASAISVSEMTACNSAAATVIRVSRPANRGSIFAPLGRRRCLSEWRALTTASCQLQQPHRRRLRTLGGGSQPRPSVGHFPPERFPTRTFPQTFQI